MRIASWSLTFVFREKCSTLIPAEISLSCFPLSISSSFFTGRDTRNSFEEASAPRLTMQS